MTRAHFANAIKQAHQLLPKTKLACLMGLVGNRAYGIIKIYREKKNCFNFQKIAYLWFFFLCRNVWFAAFCNIYVVPGDGKCIRDANQYVGSHCCDGKPHSRRCRQQGYFRWWMPELHKYNHQGKLVIDFVCMINSLFTILQFMFVGSAFVNN